MYTGPIEWETIWKDIGQGREVVSRYRTWSDMGARYDAVVHQSLLRGYYDNEHVYGVEPWLCTDEQCREYLEAFSTVHLPELNSFFSYGLRHPCELLRSAMGQTKPVLVC